MNPKTTIKKDQIREIFRYHNLAYIPRINRITIGFSNEIHQVDNFILKVYVHKDETGSFEKEAKLYEELYSKVLVPKLLVADGSRELINKPYIIYEMIPGQSLGNCWHLFSNKQRKEIIRVVCEQLKLIMDIHPDVQLDNTETWKEHICRHITEKIENPKVNKHLSPETLAKIEEYIANKKQVLDPENIQFTYWDVHQDNIIVDKSGKVTGIIDLEHVDAVSVDYFLNTVRRMVLDPARNVSEAMEKFAKPEDYIHVMGWFREFLPEAFDFPKLETRLDFYELDEDLRILPDFPKSKTLHQSIARIVE